MNYWGQFRIKRIIEKFFILNKILLLLSIVTFILAIKRSPLDKNASQNSVTSQTISSFFPKDLFTKKFLGFDPPDQKTLLFLQSCPLFQKYSDNKKMTEKSKRLAQDKKKSLSYTYHLKRMRLAQKKAIKDLLQYKLTGIIWSQDTKKSLAILSRNKQIIYVRTSDKIEDWIITAVRKTSVDFKYEKNDKIIKTLSV